MNALGGSGQEHPQTEILEITVESPSTPPSATLESASSPTTPVGPLLGPVGFWDQRDLLPLGQVVPQYPIAYQGDPRDTSPPVEDISLHMMRMRGGQL